jgi:membrane-bound serine protease (ClpP class)
MRSNVRLPKSSETSAVSAQRHRSEARHFRRPGFPVCLSIVISVLFCAATAFAQEAAEEKPAAKPPLGQFLTVTSPLDDRGVARITNVAQKLQHQAAQEGREAVLVLEILPGTSPFHHVQALSRALTNSQLASVRTVAWIPDSVTGPNVLVALSCREIVMHPDAELGDLGRGQLLEAEDRQIALGVAQKRHNPLVSTALIQAMLDPAEQLWRVRTQIAGGNVETRTVTRSELETLRNTGVVIEAADLVKEAGALGVFRGSTARGLEILVNNTANSRPDVAALYNLTREALREPPQDREFRQVRVIRLEGMITTLEETFIQRQMQRALADGAELLIFEIESPGGELLASTNLAKSIAELDPKQVRTIAYVPDMALSGAAIVALGCDEIYLQPGAKLGDAGPIALRRGGQFERAPEKILSPLKVDLRLLAEKKGRPPALAEAMADRSMKVFQVTHRDTGRVWYLTEEGIQASAGEWIAGPQVRESNGELLLTVDGRRAHELLLAESPVNDFDDLRNRLGLPVDLKLVPIQATWVDTLVFVLNLDGITILLFILGLSCLYLESQFPSGILGIICVVSFTLFFWSRFLGGTADWLEVILFVLGLGCLAVEVFVIPGFGVFGVSGILMVLASIVMASQTFGSWEPNGDLYRFARTLMVFLISVVSVGVLGTIFGRFLPHVPLFEGAVLTPPDQGQSTEPRLRPFDSASFEDRAATDALLGRQGLALSFLRPAGKARIDGRVYDVVSDGPFIPEGAAIEVTHAAGKRIVVRTVV